MECAAEITVGKDTCFWVKPGLPAVDDKAWLRRAALDARASDLWEDGWIDAHLSRLVLHRPEVTVPVAGACQKDI